MGHGLRVCVGFGMRGRGSGRARSGAWWIVIGGWAGGLDGMEGSGVEASLLCVPGRWEGARDHLKEGGQERIDRQARVDSSTSLLILITYLLLQ